MTTRTRRTAAALAGAVALTLVTSCGLQDVGVQGVVTANGVGNGTNNGLGNGSGDGSGLGPPGQPVPGATSGPGVVGGGPISGGGGIIGGGGTGGGGTGGGGGNGGGGGGGGGGGNQETPGLSGTLNISYVAVTGFDQLNKVVPVRAASTGDYNAQVAAVQRWINSHGGIGGRRLQTHVRTYNAMQASAANDTGLCNAITGDDKSSFAIIHGQIHPEARDCYKNAKVLAFDGGQYGWSQKFYNDHSPYLWSPSWPAYDQLLVALVSSAKRRGWFTGVTKIGIINWKEADYQHLREDVLVPALKGAGFAEANIVKADVSDADIGSISSDLQAAATKMVQNGVTHLMFIGSNPLQPFFIQQAGHNGNFVYAFTSMDTPRYMGNNYQSQLTGAISIGSNPVTDVLDPQLSFPQPGMEKYCVDLYKSEGVTIPYRYRDPDPNNGPNPGFDEKQAMSYCELTLLVKQVGDKLGHDWSVAQWSSAAENLGTSLPMGLTLGTRLDSTHTGATTWYDMKWNPTCTTTGSNGCFEYVAPARAFA